MNILMLHVLVLFALTSKGLDSNTIVTSQVNEFHPIQEESLNDRNVFVEVDEESDVIPSAAIWKEEMETYGFRYVQSKDEAIWIFKFRLKKALGDCRVEVTVYDAKDNKELWQSKRYRGTINIQNDISPTVNGIRKCFEKGLVPALESGKY